MKREPWHNSHYLPDWKYGIPTETEFQRLCEGLTFGSESHRLWSKLRADEGKRKRRGDR